MDKNLFLAWFAGALTLLLILFMLSVSLIPDRNTIQLSNSNTIEIISAKHLDSNKRIISDIFSSVKFQDGIWSEAVSNKEYVRIKFEQPLFFKNDMTVYPSILEGSPTITVFVSGENIPIARFTSLKENEYNKVILENLQNPEDSFDIMIENGSLQFDHILDPTITTMVPTTSTQNTTNGRLTENTYTFSTQTIISSNCYTNISVENQHNCTQIGTAALDSYFLMNVTLPEYSSIQNITVKAVASNTAGLDKLNLSFYNYTASAWIPINGTSAVPAANSRQTLTAIVNATSMPITNFVSGQSMRIMVRGQGSSNDNLKLDYLEARVTYTLNYSTNLTQVISFTDSQSDLGQYTKSFTDISSISNLANSIEPSSLTTRVISELFNFNSHQGKTSGFNKPTSQTVGLTGVSARLGSLFKLPTQLFSFNLFGARAYSTSRATSQTISFTSVVSRIEGLFRIPAQLLNFNSQSSRTQSLNRATTQQFTLNNIASRFTDLFKLTPQIINAGQTASKFSATSRSTSQTISFTSLVARIEGLFRINAQTISFNSGTSKIFAATRSTNQGLSFNLITSRFTGLFKITSQPLSFSSSQTRNGLFARANSQTISFNAITSRVVNMLKSPTQFFSFSTTSSKIFGSNRATSQTISFNSVNSRLLNLARSPIQIIGLNEIGERVTSFIKYLKNVSDSLNLNNLISRFANLFKSPSQPVSPTVSLSKSFFTSRSTSQTLSLSGISSRFTGLFRAPFGLLNFASSTLDRLGLTRNSNSQITASTITGKSVGFSRSQGTTLSLNDLTSRLAKMFKLTPQSISLNSGTSKIFGSKRSTSQTISFNNVVSRLYNVIKLPNQILTFNSKTSRVQELGRTSTNTISLASSVSRLYNVIKLPTQIISLPETVSKRIGLLRANVQQFSLNQVTSRVINLVRATSNLINFNTLTDRLNSLFRKTTDSAGFSTSTSRIFGTTRSTNQGLSFNLITSRFTGLFRAPTQVVTIQNLASRFGGLARYAIELVDRLGVTNSVNRISNLFRGVGDMFQYLLSLITGQGTESNQSTTGSSSSGSGGGSSGSSSSAVASTSGLIFIPDKFAISIKQGEVKSKELTIRNTGSTNKHLELSTPDLEKFIKFDKTSLDLAPGASITIPIIFLVDEETKADIYIGRIMLETNGVKDSVLVALSVSSNNPLFDVKVTIPDKFLNIKAGEDLLAEVSIFNLGQIGTVDVEIEYSLRNEIGETILSEKETIAVQTQSSVLKSLKLPQNIAPGNYLLYVKTIYGSEEEKSIASASAWFTVKKNTAISWTTVLIISLILLLIIAIVGLYLRNKRINKHKHENKRYTIKHKLINRSLMFRRHIVEKMTHRLQHRINSRKIKKSLNSAHGYQKRARR